MKKENEATSTEPRMSCTLCVFFLGRSEDMHLMKNGEGCSPLERVE